MQRLIDADKLRKDILDLPNCYNGFSDTYDKACIIDMIDEQPTVDADSLNAKHEDIGYEKGYRDGYAEALEVTDDAEPVRHGRWRYIENYMDTYRTIYECSECGSLSNRKDNYCWNCGAKMDGIGERKEDG